MALVIAHRGASADAYENSLAAFRRAVKVGADGIELDVHETRDHHIVVVHDPDLDGRPIATLSLDDVRGHRLPNGEQVPTLAEALDVIGDGTDTFIEVKTLSDAGDGPLLGVIDGAPAPTRCRVHGFDHRIISRLCSKRAGLPAGVLSASYLLDPVAPIAASGARALWQHADLVDVPLATMVHDAEYDLYAWTVDRPDRMRALLAMGVDGLCTNRPDLAREVVG